ncbi:type II toxin-antitoxin system ParD family antitoxin [Sphingobium sp. CAP-1]|uniref:type II toxin-antitoxin system ParD family antitoxin n=1 Tax=Sphingobium sp. CAP-1 TaxID=2676077 RepID=UPI0012BB3EF2|nr:type II toxin-antitoxin system ParD family antitoxin [Sphingobium sp. CAP-1]QGP77676.1 type II toxin-antitoxin system ParD family antitoxin [Sphingobium sp. CAP-1]
MSKSTSIALSDHFRASLRLLEMAEKKLEQLRAALIESEKSGPAEDFDFTLFLADMHQRQDATGHL